MIARLTVVTALSALFALSFATLVESSRPSRAAPPAVGCLDRGLVCAGGD